MVFSSSDKLGHAHMRAQLRMSILHFCNKKNKKGIRHWYHLLMRNAYNKTKRPKPGIRGDDTKSSSCRVIYEGDESAPQEQSFNRVFI